MMKNKMFRMVGVIYVALALGAPAAMATSITGDTGDTTLGDFTIVPDGWDGPGLGSANVTYWFGALTADGPSVAAIKAAFVSGFDAWSAATNGHLTFTEVFAAGLAGSIDISWEVGAHGDGFPFAPTTLAHAFFPAPPNPETIAGDLHMNDAFLWEIGNGLGAAAFDITLIAAHEVGHSIGVNHSAVPGALMRPTFSGNDVFLGLTADDIAGVCSLYDCSAVSVPEPGTLLLLLTGLGLFGIRSSRQQHKIRTA
jgi:hypothetical protein